MCEAWQRYARESSSGQLGEHNLYGAGVIAGAEGLLPPAMPDANALDAGEALDECKQFFCAGRPADSHGLAALEVTCATASLSAVGARCSAMRMSSELQQKDMHPCRL